MNIDPPHGPCHESTDFWYSPKHRVLLYECELAGEPPTAIVADHSQGQAKWAYDFNHRHNTPHGVDFSGSTLSEAQRKASVANIELVVRLWNETEGLEPQGQQTQWGTPIFNVPKPLALFLEARSAEMHRDDSVTQALMLLQAHIASKNL